MSNEPTFLRNATDGHPITFFEAGHHWNFLFFGTTGRGRSAAVHAEAFRRGVSYEEMLKELEPTAEQKAAGSSLEAVEREQESKRLTAVREAYWQNSSESEFCRIHDVLVSTLMEKAPQGPSNDQLKAFFMLLPAHIVGLGVSWGFNDTEVGDAVYRFIEDNKSGVTACLGLTQPL